MTRAALLDAQLQSRAALGVFGVLRTSGALRASGALGASGEAAVSRIIVWHPDDARSAFGRAAPVARSAQEKITLPKVPA